MEITLSDGQICLVDEDDLERVSKHSWCTSHNGNGNFYAQTRINTKTVYMHRFILSAPKGTMLDHRNGNSLDNRKENLRFCTKSENSLNSKHRVRRYSAYRGVTFDRNRGKWTAQLRVNGVKVLSKRFATELEAAQAYKDAVAQHCSEFVNA